MIGSDLYKPLPGRTVRRRRRPMALALSCGVLAVLCATASTILIRDEGDRGEPFAVGSISVAPPEPSPPAESLAPAPSVALSQPESRLDAVPGQQVAMENGVMVIRATQADTSSSVTLKVQDLVPKMAAVPPDPQLIETTPTGPLPRIGRDGRRPASVYAASPVQAQGRARIALVVGGMGLDHIATSEASAQLPAAVTFGFAPYGEKLADQVAKTRAAGHEVILQLPMEDFGSDDRSFPHMLKADAADNADRLHWLMSRFSGYAGVGNYLGGRLLADVRALSPVMRDIAARGLYFVDDGTAPRSEAAPLAQDFSLPAVKADVVIDAQADTASVVAALSRLETLARQHGFAVGTATGRPATNAAIAHYLAEAVQRGVVIVPVSQAVGVTAPASVGKTADAVSR